MVSFTPQPLYYLRNYSCYPLDMRLVELQGRGEHFLPLHSFKENTDISYPSFLKP
jgi:hypothetical protein